jgi:hypothetical protein
LPTKWSNEAWHFRLWHETDIAVVSVNVGLRG